MGVYKNAAVGGKAKLIEAIKSDIEVSYSNVLNEDKYKKLIDQVGNKYDAAFGLVTVGDAKVQNKTPAKPKTPKTTKPKSEKGSSQSNPLPAPPNRPALDKLKGSGKWVRLPNGTVRKM